MAWYRSWPTATNAPMDQKFDFFERLLLHQRNIY
jgi:hypothetical protein